MLNLQWPYKYNNNTLLYIMKYEIEGPMNCTSDMEINPLKIKVKGSLFRLSEYQANYVLNCVDYCQ